MEEAEKYTPVLTQHNAQKQKASLMMPSSQAAKTVVRRQYHSAALASLDDIPKEHIFKKVYNLAVRLITEPMLMARVLSQLQFLPKKQSGEEKENKQLPRKEHARISIACSVDAVTQSSTYSSTDIFSAETIHTLGTLELPPCVLSLGMVESIYEVPMPFLITLSICILLKYIGKSGSVLTDKNVSWMMSVSTIISYKLYYDEPVGGLVESFASILDIGGETVIDLERCMLEGMDYETTINNNQYHQVLCLLSCQSDSK